MTRPEYEVDKIHIQFQCEFAVYQNKGSNSTDCYTTDKQRALLIKDALNFFAEKGKLDEWINKEYGKDRI
jgi:hypothetical protein